MIVVIALLLLLFMMVVLMAHQKTVESNDFKLDVDGRRVANSVADNINTIAEQGHGYYRYYTLPSNLFGAENYSIDVYENMVSVSWNNSVTEKVYEVQTITADVTACCFSKGGGALNKVFNYHEMVLLTCERPDILVVEDSFTPASARSGAVNVPVTVDVFNYGVLSATNVNVSFSSEAFVSNFSVSIPEIAADGHVLLNVSTDMRAGPVGAFLVTVEADPLAEINESYEGDNVYNATITIV